MVEHFVVVLVASIVGLFAGVLVALVARALPRTGRLLATPSCHNCGLGIGWCSASATARLPTRRRVCPACGTGPALGDVAVEVGTAFTFALFAHRHPTDISLLIQLGFVAVLIAILVIDLRHREVYLALGYGGLVVGLLAAPFGPSGSIESAMGGAAVGAGFFGSVYLLGRLLYRGREPLGWGDVTIASLLGAMAGFPLVVNVLVMGVAAGGIAALALLIGGRGRRTFMPYGPALCLGGLVVLLLR